MKKKFIIKTLYFTSPFAILYIVTLLFYTSKNGDLARLGYIPNKYRDYENNLASDRPEKFELLSETKNKNFKIITLGDSFSELGNQGYKNVLAVDYNFSILHVDRFITINQITQANQIQTLIDMINGGFFDKYHVEYVILEKAERIITLGLDDIDFSKKLTLNQLDSLIVNHHKPTKDNQDKFFSAATIKFPLYHFPRFYLSKNYLSNKQVYNVELNTKSLFGNHSNKLLFYYDDIETLNYSNSIENAEKLNKYLIKINEMLQKKNIKLIVLPAPDKYDFYYNYISDKKQYPKPIFFDNMKKQKKDYIYIDSKEILSKHLKDKQDIYYWDDTHWSPIGSKIVGDEVAKAILQNEAEKNR